MLLAAVPLVLAAAFYILRGNRQIMDSVSTNFSIPARGILGDITSIAPFSVMELLYALLIIWALYFIVRTILLLISAGRSDRLLLFCKRLLILALVPLYIWAANCWLWYTGYYAADFSDKAGLSNEGVAPEALLAVTAFFVENARELSDDVRRDPDGHYAEDYNEYSARIYSVYDNITDEFPALDGKTRVPKKMLFSRLMSRLGFTGFYFALTGETNINTDAPACLIPSTLAHEAAHQRGVNSEDEANFAAIAACITSDDVVYQYAGFLKGTINLMNALYRVSPEDWYALYTSFSDEMHIDWADNNAYWASMESKVTEVSENIYDSYLKSNSQELGIQSYGACVDLLVEWLTTDPAEQ